MTYTSTGTVYKSFNAKQDSGDLLIKQSILWKVLIRQEHLANLAESSKCQRYHRQADKMDTLIV